MTKLKGHTDWISSASNTEAGRSSDALAFNNYNNTLKSDSIKDLPSHKTNSMGTILAQATAPPKTVQTKPSAPAEATKAEINAISGLTALAGSAWNLSTASAKNILKETKNAELEATRFAESLGQTNIKNVKVKLTTANTVTVLSSQQPEKTLSAGSRAIQVDYDSVYMGRAIHSHFTVYVSPGAVKLGMPYYNTKTGKDVPTAPTFQAILRASLLEFGVYGKITFKNRFNIDINTGFNTNASFASFKDVKDLDRSGNYTSKRALTMGADFSGFATFGPFRGGTYLEAFRFRKGHKLGVYDPYNISLTPEAMKQVEKHVPKPVADGVGYAVKTKTKQATIKLIVKGTSKGANLGLKILGIGLEKLLPSVGFKAMGAAAGMAAGRYISALAGPVGWVLTGLSVVKDYYDNEQEKKRIYKEKVQKLVELKAYEPRIGIVAALAGMSNTNTAYAGHVGRLMSDVVDEACRQKLADPKTLKQKWTRELNFVGNDRVQSLFGRMVAATVLGDAKVAKESFSQLPFTENSFLSKDSDTRKQVYSSLFNIKTKRSNALASVSGAVQILRPIPLTNPGYRSFSAKLQGGTVTATPGEVDAKGNTKWQITLTTGDGLTATTYAEMKRQFVLKDFGPNSYAKRDLESKIKAQRDRFAKPTVKYEPYVAKIYGSVFVATFVRAGENGKNFWKITGTSDVGIPATVVGAIKGQFSSENLKPGTYFKRELDKILRSQ